MDKLKSMPIPSTGQPCEICNKKMFACTTPGGATFINCPICAISQEYISSCIPHTDDEVIYCDTCNSLYQEGCTHGENGCTDDVSHGMLISNFKYLEKDYDGMPVFESYDHCVEIYPELKLTWFCTCNNNQYDCLKAGYPREVAHECLNL